MPDRKKPVVPAVIAAVAVILALATFVVPALTADEDDQTVAELGASSGATADRAPDDTWQQLVRREEGDPLAVGDVDAPVVLLAYSEFQCPFCGKFARETEPELVEQYVEDGTLRIEWKDFPYMGPESITAATAARAAGEQDMFWEFHDAMYADQLPPNSGNLTDDYVTSVAEDVGLDVEQFRKDMGRADLERAVQQDFAEGQAIGVTGTPTFVVNGIPLVGAQPIEAFEQTIEQALDEAGE